MGDTLEGVQAWASAGVYVICTCGFTQNWMIQRIPIANVLYRIRS